MTSARRSAPGRAWAKARAARPRGTASASMTMRFWSPRGSCSTRRWRAGVALRQPPFVTPEARPFVIGAAATELLASPQSFRDQFARHRSILCAGAIESGFLKTLRDLCNRGHFAPETVEKLGEREVEQPQRAGAAITLSLRRLPFMRWFEAATGCGPLADVQ